MMSPLLSILLQLVALNIPGAVTMPAGQDTAPTLRITSSIEPGRMYMGDVVGPFVTGYHLVITCSTDVSDSVLLSWWEGGKQLPTVASSEDGAVSRSLVVGTLQAKDTQRHFTCRELVSGTEKSVDLHLVEDHMEILQNGIPIEGEGKVDVLLGMDFILDCVVNGTDPSTGTWWEGEAKLPADRTNGPNAILNQLTLGPARIEDNGRQLTCRARNGQLSRTVVLNVVEGAPYLALQSLSLVLSTTGTGPTAKPPATATNIPLLATANEVEIYLIAGGAVVAVIVVVVVILIFVIVTMGKKIVKQENSTLQQQRNFHEHGADTSGTETSVPNSLGSLDARDLSPLSPLLLRPPTVKVGDETASSGGRMSVVRPDDKDHSYYYPDLIKNSYYYPKITDDVKDKILLSISGQ